MKDWLYFLLNYSLRTFTGIGISCGGGMCNVWSLSCLFNADLQRRKGGDYIDASVATVTNESSTRIRLVKEEELDLFASAQGQDSQRSPYLLRRSGPDPGHRTRRGRSIQSAKAGSSIPIVLSGRGETPQVYTEI